MTTINLVIPRWFYPYNLGDSIHSFFAPKVIKYTHPDCKLNVFTTGELVNLMKLNPYVDEVSNASIQGSYSFWRSWAFAKTKPDKNTYCIFADWHPKVWDFWNENFDYLSQHNSANILTVNSLLELGMESTLFEDVDFNTPINLGDIPVEENTIGIVPATKLSGKPIPHTGCDGLGFRFNGDNGESWRKFVDTLRSMNGEIKIVEFSPINLGFGDEHVGELPWIELLKQVSRVKLGVMSDGGMHHVFNSIRKPLVYLSSQKISKETHLMLGNATFYEDLHSLCRSRCYNKTKELQGWDDLDSICDKSCQKVNPVALAENIIRDYFND